MKGIKALAAVLIVTGLLASALTASAGAASPFRHYVACGISQNSKPAHACPKAAKKGAFFKSTKADVVYAVCVKFPSGKDLCAHAQKAEQGTLYVNKITSTIVGVHVVSWYVKGKKVGATIFRVTG